MNLPTRSKNRLTKLLAATILVLQTALPHSASAAPAAPKDDEGTTFGFRLFDKACEKQSAKDNVLVSPTSAYFALCMAANGADQQTLAQMLRVLGVHSAVSAMNTSNQTAMSALKSTKGVTLETADALFTDHDRMPLQTAFVETCKQYYDAEVKSVHFSSPQAIEQINKWSSEHTHGKIPTILGEGDVNSGTFMVLLNSVYFKGFWQKKFDPTLTTPGQFTLPDGSTKRVSMMSRDERMAYYDGRGFSAVELPYGQGTVSMFILLPAKGTSLARLREQLSPRNWDSWITSFQDQHVDLRLPKFKIEFKRTLNDDLKALGMLEAFDADKADFSKMLESNHRGCLQEVIQKTYMDVNEEGTEAAAVTSVGFAAAMAPIKPKSFIVDHPFILVLRDNVSKQILFLGSIVNP